MHVYGIIEVQPDGSPGEFIKIGKGPADRRVKNHQPGNPRELKVAFWALYDSDKTADEIETAVLKATQTYATVANNEWRRLDGNVLAALDALQDRPETVKTKWEIALLDVEKLALAAELCDLKTQPYGKLKYKTEWDAFHREHKRHEKAGGYHRVSNDVQYWESTLESEKPQKGVLGFIFGKIETQESQAEAKLRELRPRLEAARIESEELEAERRRLWALSDESRKQTEKRIAEIEALLAAD